MDLENVAPTIHLRTEQRLIVAQELDDDVGGLIIFLSYFFLIMYVVCL